MDCIDEEGVESLTLMFASQLLGKTEIETCIIGSRIDQDPCPILMTLPTHHMAKAWSKTKLQPMIDSTPSVRSKMGGAARGRKGKALLGSGNNTIQLKEFPGGFLVSGGANSPAGLAMYTCKITIFDEPDRYPVSAGDEGDPIGIGSRRSETFPDAFSIQSGTPTIKGFSRIETQYDATDKRKWFVKCENPECPQPEFVIMWDHIIWDKDKDEKGKTVRHYPETARVECPACGHRHDETARRRTVKAGRWVATKPEVTRRRGYWANAFLCLLPPKKGYRGWLHRWVEEFLDAVSKGPETLKGVVNTVFCESFEIAGDAPTSPEILCVRREDYFDEKHKPEETPLPEDVLVLTAALDVQGDRVEGQIVGWGLGEEAWAIDYRIFYGNTELKSFWGEIDEWIQGKFKHPCGKTLSPACVAIDANYVSRRVYGFVKQCQPRRVFAVRGIGSGDMPWVNKSRKKSILYNLNVDAGKSTLFSRLSMLEPGPGYIHFPMTFGLEYFEQVTAERIVTTHTYGIPIRHFVLPRSKRNEAWDTWVYNLAALELLRPNFRVIAKSMGIKLPTFARDTEESPPQVAMKKPVTQTVRSRINAARKYMGGWR
jgi:phage terminase large subunit GpA-like protein